MLTIGEFSRVTRLSVKALRLYHEKGLLIPGKVDLHSKYRYYRSSDVEKGLTVVALKEMGFSLEEIKTIIHECADDGQLTGHAKRKLSEVDARIKELSNIRDALSDFLDTVHHPWSAPLTEIRAETIPPSLIASIRFSGKYEQVDGKFRTLFKACGGRKKGKPFSLWYDDEYTEEATDIEACLEVTLPVQAPGIHCRELPGGYGVTLFHNGPYNELGRSYARLFAYCRENNMTIQLPLREYYLKGPGLIFRGNPAKYLTQIIAMIAPDPLE